MALIDRSSDGPDLRNSVEIVCRHAWVKHRDYGAGRLPVHVHEVRGLRSHAKTSSCRLHKAATQDKRSSREYYGEAFDDGIPQNATYAVELASALREMDAPSLPRGGSLLEVGCGIGRLVPWFLHGGMRYTAVETDPWAGRYDSTAASMVGYWSRRSQTKRATCQSSNTGISTIRRNGGDEGWLLALMRVHS